jgi:capsular polysaccharide biosynthesis protein
VAIAESPTVPFEPAGPGKALILLLALAVAFVCSVVVAFVVDYLDPSFRTPEEVRAFLGVPVLASVSKTTP